MQRKILLFLLTVMVVVGSVHGQTYNITSTPNGGQPPGGYVATYNTTGGTELIGGPQSVNSWSLIQTLPFTFYFYGAPVTQYKVSGNGVLTFDVNTTILPGSNTTIPSASLPDSSIAFLWDDFSASAPTASGDDVRTQTFGTAPNRQQWIWYYSYEIGSPAVNFAYFALVLEETTNNIYIVDHYNGTPLTSTTSVGIQLNSTTGVMDPLSPGILRGTNGTAVTDDDLWTLIYTSPCTSPPNAGSAVASNTTPCLGQSITLDLNVNTSGLSGQTYQWESATSPTGPWVLEGTLQTTPLITVTPPIGTTYYRAQVTCGASTVTSIEDTVTVPTPYPGGIYTINSAAPTGGGNFQNFTDAMSAIGCGISGPITFNVVPGSGPYTEQIIMPNTIGSNSTNTVTINGNGETVEYSASAASIAVVMIDGVDYVKIDSLTIKTLGTSFGSGIMLYNACDFDTLTNLIVDASSVTGTVSTNAGIRISTTPSGTSTTASGASNTYVANCQIIGNATSNNGIYYGLYAYGPNTNNHYHNNKVTNSYLYSMYVYYGDLNIISNNSITRQTKANTGYCYGLVTGFLTGGSQVIKNKIEYLGGASNNASYSYPMQIISSAGTASSPVLVANNVISNSTAVPLYGLYINGGSYIDLYHNTVSIDLPLTYSTTTNQSGIYSTSTTANIMNNIVSYKGGGPNTKYGIYLSSAPTSCDYNNIYMNSTVAGTQYYGYRGSSYSTLAAFQGSTPFEVNGHADDPVLVNSGGLPVPTSVAMDNMGTPILSVSDDILGMPRDIFTPDVGALEYVPPTCPPATAPTVITTTTTTADISWTANPSTTLWEVEYAQGSTFALGTGTRLIVNMNPYTLGSVTPLSPSTQYTYFVRDICAPNDTSLWSSRSPIITTLATCDTPSAPQASNPTASGADLNWTENGTAILWEIEYGTGTSFALGTGTRLIVNSNPYTLSPPLAQGTTYSYFVRSICGANDTSVWSPRSAGFTTLVSCPAPTGIGIANATANSFDVTWTASGGTEILEYGPTGHIPGIGATAGVGGTLVLNPTSPYTISGLSPSSGYDVFIRQDCSALSNGYSLNLSRNASTLGAPANDTICGAYNLTLNNSSPVWVNTNNATTSSTDPAFGCTTPNNNVWFKFTTTAAGVYNITAYSTQITSYSTYYGNMSAWSWLYSSSGTCPSITLTQIADLTLCSATLYAPAQYPVPPNASRIYATPTLSANATYYILADGADGSYGNIGFTVQSPLDIKLGDISALNVGNSNRVDWSTLSEEITDKFELQRSVDGKSFETITSIGAKGYANRYSYVDNTPFTGINYYRLMMRDASGKTEYSKVVNATVQGKGFSVQAYPNPVSDELTIKVNGNQSGNAELLLTDMTGKVIKRMGMNGAIQTVNMNGLASGIYLIKYVDDEQSQTLRITKE